MRGDEKMLIDLSKIMYSSSYKLEIDDSIIIEKEILENTDIKDISPVKVSGFIYDNDGEYELDISVSGEMILSCARTLKDVKYPFDININEIIDENNENSLQIIQNRLDIFPIIWQNILVDVPLRVLHPDAKEESLEGDGWRLITEDDKKEVIDPRLSALSKFNKE